MSELDAGLLIGGGATVLFALLVYLMANRNSEEDEATSLYRQLLHSLETDQHVASLMLAKEYQVALNSKTKEHNDLGEAFSLIARSAERLGNHKLALFSAEIASRYLLEESVQNYPLYKACRNSSIEIKRASCARLSAQEVKEIEQSSEQIWVEKREGVGKFMASLK
jgi:hypothetical protein